jgi:L-alanine-DL-glutamate epimerase-like enolase superfamily enzyme
MKITRIEALPLWAGHRNFTFVLVHTDEGFTGIGEAGLTSRERAILGVLEHLEPIVVGEDPFRSELLWQRISRGAFFPAGLVTSAALSAIDMALWDIKGKALGRPVFDLLGGRVRDRVVCYPHNSGETPEALVDSCLRTVDEGWKFVRWGLPSGDEAFEPACAVELALRQFEAVRKRLGNHVELCFDVHTRLDLPDSVYLLNEVKQFRPFFMEDPLRFENTGLYRRLRQQTATPIAAGEQAGNKWQFRELVEEDLIDYARVDLCLVGGITEARKIAGWCETHHIKLAVHNPLGPVSSAAALHVNLATPNFGVQEQPRRPSEILPEVFPVQPVWEDGYLLPTDAPGLGIELNRKAADRFGFQSKELPQLRRPDGSFTNW